MMNIEKTIEAFSPYCAQSSLPKDFLPVLSFAYGFGFYHSQNNDPTQKAAQKLTIAFLNYFSFGHESFEEGTTVNQEGNIIPIPFHQFEKAMEIAKTKL